MTIDENTPWMTILMCVLVTMFAAVGGVVAIIQPDTLSFADYLDRLGTLSLAVAGLGVGRSLKKGLRQRAAPAAGATGKPSLNDRPIMTITLGLLVVIAGGVGGAIVIANPAVLDFDTYLDKMSTFAFAVGLQGAGRAVRKGIQAPGTDASGEPEGAAPAAGPGAPRVSALRGAVPAGPRPSALATAVRSDDAALAPVTSVALADPVDPDALPTGDGEPPLPSDEEEDAAPPPLADGHLLDEPGEPNVRMPSQDADANSEVAR